ncbi:ribosomal protection-like ABC-F family protein [Bacillus sp. D386]|uniref:ribosomal protection-like ABC-F family protein n=1 Tax=Bacillus sp. D386 TaxID=2587155 RepID=UPI00112300A5|nr:ABC-F type ribosomal protection protein [Bacillus sp. D386]
MNMLSLKEIQKSYGERTILKNINMIIESWDRIGLIGYNGAGKTTLANIMTGAIQADKGNISFGKDHVSIGYLRQSIDYTASIFQSMLETGAEAGMFELTSQLGLEGSQLWNQERLDHLSGGERLKLALAHIWSTKPDLLILDEPTNHLDFDGILWLVEELASYQGAAIIISHDRYFLDLAVKRIYEIEDGIAHEYTGNYSAYKKQKEENRRIHKHQYDQQQKEIKRVEAQMNQLKNWSEKAHRDSTKHGTASERKLMGKKEYYRVKAKKKDIQVKSKRKRLEAELTKKRIEKPADEVKIEFDFQAADKRGKRIVEAKDLKKQYRDHTVFQSSYFYIKHGESIGVVGPNGAGKTTLIRLILDQEPISGGELWKSPTLKIGYLSQDVGDLPVHKKPIEALGLYERDSIFKAKTYLANLGITARQIDEPISSLSMGQRTKIKLVQMLMEGYDLLILDEPTNHLDLPSREQLEETLSTFAGTLVIVSHDQYLIERLCNKLLVIDEKIINRVERNNRNPAGQIPAMNRNIEEELMVVETKLAAVLSQLSLLTSVDSKYSALDKEFKQLIEQKAILNRTGN